MSGSLSVLFQKQKKKELFYKLLMLQIIQKQESVDHIGTFQCTVHTAVQRMYVDLYRNGKCDYRKPKFRYIAYYKNVRRY